MVTFFLKWQVKNIVKTLIYIGILRIMNKTEKFYRISDYVTFLYK